ncbi:MAG: ABC transporter ATP-binding protein/permease [Oscillospiraceae bacterium]|jgi:ATP-binding cassette subfamily B protein|nr:ABC transporter ATP-binding protein/permease [Oscillospiraceae bacterium]
MTELHNDRSFISNTRVLLSPYKKNLIAVAFCVTVVSVLNIFFPLVNKAIIDKGVIAKDFAVLVFYLSILAILFIATKLFDFIEFAQLTKINKQMETDLTKKSTEHLLKLKLDYFKTHNEAQIMNNIRFDISKLCYLTDRYMLVSIVQIFSIIGGIIGLCVLDAKLLIFVILSIPAKLLIVRHYTAKREATYKKTLSNLNKFGSWFGDTLNSIDIVKLWGLHKQKISDLLSIQNDSVKTSLTLEYTDKYSDTLESLIDFFLNCVLYLVGLTEIISGELTAGGLMAFIAYTAQVISPVSFLTKIKYHFVDVFPSMKRYIEFMQMPEEGCDDPKEKLVRVPDVISFNNVSFSYGGNRVINNISFMIKKRQKIALVGDNGCGKSTLINLLLRFYEPAAGKIQFDGVDIIDYDIDAYREMFAVVRQDAKLFNTTIRDNIDPMGRHTEEGLFDTFNSLALTDVLETHPEGLNTVVGKNGAKLSGGEAQKLSVLRAVLKNAKILILDEATSSFDLESEKVCNAYICEMMKYDYIIVITHREDILKYMDKVIRLDNGEIVN